jgi:AcrR family transcriptional regulator
VDERRAQLLALGVEAFSERPYDEVSIDDVARKAGISKGLLYHYFATKRDFYAATVREGARQLVETTDVSPEAPPLERLERGLDAYLDYVLRHSRAYVALLRSGIGSDPEVARIVDETRGEFFRRFVESIEGLTPTPLQRAAIRAWIGFVEAMSLELAEHPTLDRRALRDLAIRVLETAFISPEP